MQLRVGSIGSNSAIVSFDLTTQQKTLPDGTSGTSSTGVNWNILDSGITDEGDGWFRVFMSFNVDGGIPRGSFKIIQDMNEGDASSSNRFTGDGTSAVSLTGVQSEDGGTTPSLAAYTNGTATAAPRFDHDPVTGESLGLLVEQARTNEILYSDVLNSWWNKNALSVHQL